MINWIKSHRRFTCITLAVVVALFISIPKCTEVTESKYSEPSVLPIPKIKSKPAYTAPPKAKPNIPVKEKIVFKKKKKELRDSAEKGDIILNVKLVNGHVMEDVIDSIGNVSQLDTPIDIKLPEGVNEAIVTPEGIHVEPEKKTKVGKIIQDVGKAVKITIKRAGKGLAIAGAVAVTGAVAIAGAPVVAVVAVGVATGIVVVAVLAEKDYP